MTLALGADPEPQQHPAELVPLPGRLVGLEEELLLVDAETLEPVPAATRILHGGPLTLPCGSQLEAEVKSEQIEVVTPPLGGYDDIVATIVGGRRAADLRAQQHGARAVAMATPAHACDPHLVHTPRYERMRERFGLTMDEQLTCGLHVHVSISSPQEGVAVLDRIRPWLPVLLALSANSPYWHGVDSRFASYRYQAWSRWPSAGAYDRFHTAEGYAAAVDAVLSADVSLDRGMIYFDARLSSHAPTVEIRIADVCLRPQDAACLAVLIRALVEASAASWRDGVPAADTPTSLLRLASWRASRWGLSQELMSPALSRPVPAAAAVDELLAFVGPHVTDAAEGRIVRHGIREILRRGNGADRQRSVGASGGGPGAVVRDALAHTHDAG